MEPVLSICKTSELCRLCMVDLSEVEEYYTVDEQLRDLISTLTGILVCLHFFLIYLSR